MKDHTPGPWEVCDNYIDVYAPKSDTAITNHNHICAAVQSEAEANARLIAECPVMYELLVHIYENEHGLSNECHEKIWALLDIVAAEGE